MTDHRKARIRQRLDRLEELGIIRSYMIQSGMPGLRWTLEGGSGAIFSTRSYTTSQVEDFLTGALSAYYVTAEVDTPPPFHTLSVNA